MFTTHPRNTPTHLHAHQTHLAPSSTLDRTCHSTGILMTIAPYKQVITMPHVSVERVTAYACHRSVSHSHNALGLSPTQCLTSPWCLSHSKALLV